MSGDRRQDHKSATKITIVVPDDILAGLQAMTGATGVSNPDVARQGLVRLINEFNTTGRIEFHQVVPAPLPA